VPLDGVCEDAVPNLRRSDDRRSLLMPSGPHLAAGEHSGRQIDSNPEEGRHPNNERGGIGHPCQRLNRHQNQMCHHSSSPRFAEHVQLPMTTVEVRRPTIGTPDSVRIVGVLHETPHCPPLTTLLIDTLLG